MHLTAQPSSDCKMYVKKDFKHAIHVAVGSEKHRYTVTGGEGCACLKHVQYEDMWSVKGREVWHYPQSPTPHTHPHLSATCSSVCPCTAVKMRRDPPPHGWHLLSPTHTNALSSSSAVTTHCDPLHLPWHGDVYTHTHTNRENTRPFLSLSQIK